MNNPNNKNKAFTLVEVVIVVVILGILAGIAAFAYSRSVHDAQDKAAVLNVQRLLQLGYADKAIKNQTGYVLEGDNFFDQAKDFKFANKNVDFVGTEKANIFGEISIGFVSSSLYETNTVADYTRIDQIGVATLSESGNCVYGVGDDQGNAKAWVSNTKDNCSVRNLFSPLEGTQAPKVEDLEQPTPTTQPTVEETPKTDPTPTTPSGEEKPVNDNGETQPTVEETQPPLTGNTPPNPYRHLLYSGTNLTITNYTRFYSNSGGMDIHVEGNFACNSNSEVSGSIVATGSINLTNNCVVGKDVVAGGNINTSTTGIKIGGDIISEGGDVIVSNHQILVGGKIQTFGFYQAKDGGKPPAVVEQNVAAKGRTWPQTMPTAYAREYTSNDWNQVSWSQIINNSAVAANAPSWSNARKANTCESVSSANYSVNGPIITPNVPTVIDGRGCGSVEFNGAKLKLNADVTIIANNFQAYQQLNVESNGNHTLRIIVPTSETNPACGTTNQVIRFTNGYVTPENVKTLLYSSGSTNFSGNSTFYGQTYSCTINISNNTTVYGEIVGK